MEIHYHTNLIESSTTKALLLKIPKESLYFWFPKSLVSLKGSRGTWLKLFIPEDFKITVKNKKGNNAQEWDGEKLLYHCSEMDISILESISANKRKKVDGFVRKRVRLENPTSEVDESLRD